ncbi:MAG: hypothetical protein DI626_02310 [Micavibrio aeruginosavorus]|uniref:Uncharacterized protein n=1 Tax=Micavibrio aeruginosavorus TaxID=349221 RepID=A0A2W5A0S5_9BACT|nr:MAG: hypothetical protein DI626_02310 [Micavibrio aeruginosavorus]
MISSAFKSAAIAGGVIAGLVAHVDTASGHWNDHDEKTYDLSKHHDFIMNVRLKDGYTNCCNGDDVFVDLEEIENPDGGYTVIVPAGTVIMRDSSGNISQSLEKDTTVVIPPDRVLSGERAFQSCKELVKQGSKTCTAPNVNVLYIAPSRLMRPDVGTPYCYWPTPKGF